MTNIISIDGFAWEQVPVHMIEHLDCEVFILNYDGSESLVEEGDELSEFETYVIEPSASAVARAWLVANGYEAETLAGDLVIGVSNYDEEVLTIGLSDLTINNLADRFRREAFRG
jgi:hypothetical protein